MEFSPASVWLKPSELDFSEIGDSQIFIGNYPVLDIASEPAQDALREIAREKSGTWFMVLRFTEENSEEPLLRLGSSTLYADRATVHGRQITLPEIKKDSATIIKLGYQGSTRNRRVPSTVRLREDLQLAEAIYYDRILDKEESRIVESYLAMKYSVNITANEDPDLRDYVDTEKNAAWDSRSDHPFDEEVLALGRNDNIGFYQTQTFTADYDGVQLSLSPTSQKGAMPSIDITDGSMFVLSKKKGLFEMNQCGSAPTARLWKIKLMDWEAASPNIYLTVDTVLPEAPLLSDGREEISLPFEVIGERTQVTIPIRDGQKDQDLFLIWGNAEKNCEPLCRVQAAECDLEFRSNGSLKIDIDPMALPATFELLSLERESSLAGDIETAESWVENLEGGQYQISIRNREMELADYVFTLANCGGENGEIREDDNLNENSSQGENLTYSATPPADDPFGENPNGANVSADGKGGGHGLSIVPSDRRYIEIFPNPARVHKETRFFFRNLDGQEFQVDIFDPRGKLLVSKTFTPEAGRNSIPQRFSMKGSYHVRLASGGFFETRQIIVN